MDYNKYLRSDHWKEVKRNFYRFNIRKCFICKSTKNLNLHHKKYVKMDGRSIFYLEQNHELICLCAECHGYWHANHSKKAATHMRISDYKKLRRMIALGCDKKRAFQLLRYWTAIKPAIEIREREEKKKRMGATPRHAQNTLQRVGSLPMQGMSIGRPTE